MKNPQKGFIVSLLVVFIAVLVIGSGVYGYKNKLSKEFYFQEEKINNYSVCSFGNGDEESYSFSYYFIHPTKNFATEIGSSTSKLILTPILSTFKFIK